MYQASQNTGWLEVIAGCMYSGKTEELIRRCRRTTYAKQVVQVFKPAIDDRYTANDVVTHVGVSLAAISVVDPRNIPALSEAAQVVGIDEAQFFDDTLIGVVQHLVRGGKRVIIAGLDLDYTGKPFGPMPQLLAMAEFVTKVQAVCVVCGNSAFKTQRLTQDEAQVVIGAEGVYEARCRAHWSPPEEP